MTTVRQTIHENAKVNRAQCDHIWVRRLPGAREPRFRLFCFPYAGGGATAYSSWPAHLEDWIEVCPILLPGREERFREAPYRNLAQLTDALSTAIVPYLDRPYTFFGHSMGALIAFELSRRLRDMLERIPEILFVSGRGAPHLPSPRSQIHQLSDTAFVKELRALNGTPQTVLQNKELMRLLLPTLRADFKLVADYEYAPAQPLPCSIVAFGGKDDQDIGPQQLADWQGETSGHFTLKMFPGDHFFLHNAQDVLVETIYRILVPLNETDNIDSQLVVGAAR